MHRRKNRPFKIKIRIKNPADKEEGKPDETPFENLKCTRCNKLFKYRSSFHKHVSLANEENSFRDCSICNAPFCLTSDLKKHMTLHVKNGELVQTWKCERCNAVFKHKQSLNKHLSLSANENGGTGPLTCHMCDELFCLPNNQQKHIAYHKADRQNGVWNCEKCDKIFNSRDLLATHIFLSSREDDVILKCSTCDKKFCLSSDLDKHLPLHGEATKYICNICSKSFLSKRNLSEHQGTHNKPSFVCPKCGKMFRTQKNLRRHNKSHNSDRNFTCEICGKGFRTAVVLNGHKGIHTKKYRCESCDKNFSTHSHLRSHEIFMHGRAAPFTCAVCGKGVPSQLQLDKHLRTHTGERPFVCDIPGCGKAFKERKNLKDHKNCVHRMGVTHGCTLCELAFPTARKLNFHIRTHLGIKPFVCEYCGKAFGRKGGLVSHRRIHTGESPYECEVCKKSSKNSGNLKIHKRTHSGEKPYECLVCHKRSSCFSNFKKHWKVHPPPDHMPFEEGFVEGVSLVDKLSIKPPV